MAEEKKPQAEAPAKAEAKPEAKPAAAPSMLEMLAGQKKIKENQEKLDQEKRLAELKASIEAAK